MKSKLNEFNAIVAIVVKCNKCGHVWSPNHIELPNYCPKCKRTDWYK